MTADYHLHSYFSGDSRASCESVIQAAVNRRLSVICFTEHIDLDYPYEDICFEPDLDAYFSEMRRLESAWKGQLEIRAGAELGLQPHLKKEYDRYLEGRSFDFLIGSTHLADRQDPYYPDFWAGRNVRDSIRRYLEITLDNISVFDDFDVYGHLDYIIRYAPKGSRCFSMGDYAEQIDAMIQLLLQKGKGLEINTGGYKAGLAEPNPCSGILKRYRELGGEIVTLGSDAHTPEYVGYRLEDAMEVLRSCGFRYYTVFRERKPCFVSL